MPCVLHASTAPRYAAPTTTPYPFKALTYYLLAYTAYKSLTLILNILNLHLQYQYFTGFATD